MSDPGVGVSRLRVALAWLPAIAYTQLIWWLSSQALDVAFLERVPLRDKGVHALEYAAMGLFLAHAVATTWRERRGVGGVLAATLMTATLGLMDELHQAYVPFRSSDLLDLVADVAGGLTASVLYGLVLWLVTSLRARRTAPLAT